MKGGLAPRWKGGMVTTTSGVWGLFAKRGAGKAVSVGPRTYVVRNTFISSLL